MHGQTKGNGKGACASASGEWSGWRLQACAPDREAGPVQQQHLFSVYLHPQPEFGRFPPSSIFYGLEIEERVQVGQLLCLDLKAFILLDIRQKVRSCAAVARGTLRCLWVLYWKLVEKHLQWQI